MNFYLKEPTNNEKIETLLSSLMTSSIQVQIHSTSLALSDEQKTYVGEKAAKILRYSGRADDESTKISVEINNEQTKDKKNHIHCVVNIFVPRQTLHAESYGETVEASIDECEDKLTRQIHKYKEKMQH